MMRECVECRRFISRLDSDQSNIMGWNTRDLLAPEAAWWHESVRTQSGLGSGVHANEVQSRLVVKIANSGWKGEARIVGHDCIVANNSIRSPASLLKPSIPWHSIAVLRENSEIPIQMLSQINKLPKQIRYLGHQMTNVSKMSNIARMI